VRPTGLYSPLPALAPNRVACDQYVVGPSGRMVRQPAENVSSSPHGNAGNGGGTPGPSGVRAVFSNIATIV
jgi:hypothetical protein